MSTSLLDLQHISIISNVTDKNARAHQIIKRYAAEHAYMDIGIGLVSLVPGAGIPAIIAAIALQSKVIYKPMAEELAAVYLAQTDAYTDTLGTIASVSTVALEFAQEFAIEFLGECAQELLMEAGMGALATCIPVAGAVVAAGLDFLIAQMLTWRVGAMTSMYFQNGGQWIGDRKRTMQIAKELTGGLVVSMSDAMSVGRQLLSKSAPDVSKGRFDLNDIPKRVDQVKNSGVNNLLPLIKRICGQTPPNSRPRSIGCDGDICDSDRCGAHCVLWLSVSIRIIQSPFAPIGSFHERRFRGIIRKAELGLTAFVFVLHSGFWQQGPYALRRGVSDAKSITLLASRGGWPHQRGNTNARDHYAPMPGLQEPELLHHQEQEDDHRTSRVLQVLQHLPQAHGT